MKIIERSLLATLAIVLLLAVHQIVSKLFERHGWKGMDASGWAAWIQAIGAIAAIHWSSRQFSKQRETEVEDRKNSERDERIAHIFSAVMHGAHARKIMRQYESLDEGARRTPVILSQYAKQLDFPITGLQAIPFAGVLQADAHAITKTLILLADVQMILALSGHAKERLAQPLDLTEANKMLAIQMDILCNTHTDLTGVHPIPAPAPSPAPEPMSQLDPGPAPAHVPDPVL